MIHKQLKWIPTTAPCFWLQCVLGVVVKMYLNMAAFILHFCILPGHYGMAGGQDLHNFISSGFLTLGRGHLKGKIHPSQFIVTLCGSAKRDESLAAKHTHLRRNPHVHSDTSASVKAPRHTRSFCCRPARRHHRACACLTAQHSVDDSGQMSWQGDVDMPLSYGTFSHTRRWS